MYILFCNVWSIDVQFNPTIIFVQSYDLVIANSDQEKCHNLLSLDFTSCTSIQPGFFIKFFQNFPLLTKINLAGSLVDDETFNSIGSLCSNLREMIATDSTISDKGLMHLCRGEEDPKSLRSLMTTE